MLHRIEYAYPSSDCAVMLGKGKTGTWCTCYVDSEIDTPYGHVAHARLVDALCHELDAFIRCDIPASRYSMSQAPSWNALLVQNGISI